MTAWRLLDTVNSGWDNHATRKAWRWLGEWLGNCSRGGQRWVGSRHLSEAVVEVRKNLDLCWLVAETKRRSGSDEQRGTLKNIDEQRWWCSMSFYCLEAGPTAQLWSRKPLTIIHTWAVSTTQGWDGQKIGAELRNGTDLAGLPGWWSGIARARARMPNIVNYKVLRPS